MKYMAHYLDKPSFCISKDGQFITPSKCAEILNMQDKQIAALKEAIKDALEDPDSFPDCDKYMEMMK